jgi:hypothetical protein
MATNTWHDARTMHRSFRSIQKTEPHRWREVVESCRQSRRFRRWWLRTVRDNPAYLLLCAWRGVRP